VCSNNSSLIIKGLRRRTHRHRPGRDGNNSSLIIKGLRLLMIYL